MLACIQTVQEGRLTVDPTLVEQAERAPAPVAVDQLGPWARRRLGAELAKRERELTRIETAKAKRLADVEAQRIEDELAEERRVHALQVAQEEREQAARQADQADDSADAAAKKKREKRYAKFAARRSLATTLVIIGLSLATAIPAQIEWFTASPRNLAVLGVTLALLIELLSWLGAFLYVDAVESDQAGLARLYRGLTWFFASIAATINFAHGAEKHFAIGVGYALASLMGVGAFEVYMHRTRHRKSGMSAAEIKLLALRRWKFRKVVNEQARLRATYGLKIADETLWRMAYLRIEGNPTIPVPISALFVREFAASLEQPANMSGQNVAAATEVELTPEPSSRDHIPEQPGGSVLTLEPEQPANDEATVEVLADWVDVDNVDELIARHWPALSSQDPANESEQPANSPADPSGETSEISANTANSPSEIELDPHAPVPADLDETVKLKDRLRAYYERVRSLGVADEDLDWRRANTACGGSERYAQIGLKDYLAELAANTANDPSQGGGGKPELR
jgi:hypothetical protein